MSNYGLQLEKHFISFFNKRKFQDFFGKWRKHLKIVFPNIQLTDTVRSYKYEDAFAKPDIVVQVKGVKKNISIKSGRNPSVHQEHYKNWYRFMIKLGISEETRRFFSLYHFGTSKYFGVTGTPLTKAEIVERYGDLIYKANKEINTERIIKNVTYRAIISGAVSGRERIDYFYYGNLERGILASPEQIYSSVLSNKTISRTYLHFGELVYQPSGRDRKRRDYMYARIHWPALTWLYYRCNDENNILDRPEYVNKESISSPEGDKLS